MATALTHSPADVVRWLLVDLGLVGDPDMGTEPWPCYNDEEPDTPDNCVTTYDTLGRDDGRTMGDGERQEFPGIMVRVRATTKKISYAKAEAIAISLDQQVSGSSVTVDGATYNVQNVSRTSSINRVGMDKPGSKRSVYTVNAVVCIQQTGP